MGFTPFRLEKLPSFRGKTYDLDRRVIHVQLPTDIGLPPYLVGFCTRSVYGLADAPRRWWESLRQVSDFHLAFNQQELTDALMCVMMVLLRSQKQVSFADSEANEPAPVSYYGVGSQQSEVTRDESSDTAEEVHKSLFG